VEPSTVKHHVRELMRKLELHDRRTLARHFNQPIDYSPSPPWGGKD
jgi:DNA-binding NarL/FixJ family response regulator